VTEAAISLHNRGDLSAAQRAASAAEVATIAHGTNRYAQKVDPPNGGSTPVTVAEAATMFNVPIRSVERAKKRMREDADEGAAG
jgi:hypothetical protein